MGAAIKHPLPAKDQSARMSKITNDGLNRSGTGCFIAVGPTHMATVGVKGLNNLNMFVFCFTWLTRSSNINMFVVDLKQFTECTNVREHKHV